MKIDMKRVVGAVVVQALALAGVVACGSVADSETATEGAAAETALEEDVGTAKDAVSFGQQGFAWINSGTVGYPYAFVTSGGTITVTNPSTGNYTVTFPGIGGAGGNVQVVAYGGTNERCKVTSWGWSGTNQLVNVRCHTPANANVNTSFVVQFARPGSGPGAFLWADQPSTASYNPSSSYSWNSTGGVNRIVRASAGVYTAYLPGLAVSGGTVQVTAYDSTGNHCKVQGWGPSGTEQSITVRCFNTAGAAVDSYFSLNFFGNGQVSVYDQGAYVWANDPSSESYTPASSWSYDSGYINGWPGCSGWLGVNTAGKTSLGNYFVTHSNMTAVDSAVHVTSYGSDNKYCKVSGWFGSGSGVQVNTKCFTGTGAAADSLFVETYATKWLRGPC